MAFHNRPALAVGHIPLAKLIDDLGKARSDLAKRTARERDLAERVRLAMEEAGQSVADGRAFRALLAATARLTVAPAAIRRRFRTERAWLACLRVDVAAATEALGHEVLAQVGTVVHGRSLRITPLD